jgi:hypothetical protein
MDQAIRNLRLSNHVFLQKIGTKTILLDLRRDEYAELDAQCTSALHPFVEGWPAPEPGEITHLDSNTIAQFVETLLKRGILTPHLEQGKTASPVVIPSPRVALIEYEVDLQPKLSVRHLPLVFAAAARARLSLRFQPIEQVISNVIRRREHAQSSGEFNLKRAHELVRTFSDLRPLLFTAKDACLFDSLALLHFLAYYKLFPQWIFGVQTSPFAAHCWLQHRDVILNDCVDHARMFTPILAA